MCIYFISYQSSCRLDINIIQLQYHKFKYLLSDNSGKLALYNHYTSVHFITLYALNNQLDLFMKFLVIKQFLSR